MVKLRRLLVHHVRWLLRDDSGGTATGVGVHAHVLGVLVHLVGRKAILALCVSHVVLRYCHLCSVHMVTHLFQRRGSIFSTVRSEPVRTVSDCGLQLTACVNYRLLLLLLLLLLRWDLRLLQGIAVRLLWYHTTHLTRRTIGSRISGRIHILLIIAHPVVRRKARIRRHISLASVTLTVVVHLLAGVESVHARARIVTVHV